MMSAWHVLDQPAKAELTRGRPLSRLIIGQGLRRLAEKTSVLCQRLESVGPLGRADVVGGHAVSMRERRLGGASTMTSTARPWIAHTRAVLARPSGARTRFRCASE